MQAFAGFDLYWVELFFLTQGLRCSAQRFAGFDLYWVESFFLQSVSDSSNAEFQTFYIKIYQETQFAL